MYILIGVSLSKPHVIEKFCAINVQKPQKNVLLPNMVGALNYLTINYASRLLTIQIWFVELTIS